MSGGTYKSPCDDDNVELTIGDVTKLVKIRIILTFRIRRMRMQMRIEEFILSVVT